MSTSLTVRPFVRSDGASPQPIHARYERQQTSGLEFAINPKGGNEFELVVEAP